MNPLVNLGLRGGIAGTLILIVACMSGLMVGYSADSVGEIDDAFSELDMSGEDVDDPVARPVYVTTTSTVVSIAKPLAVFSHHYLSWIPWDFLRGFITTLIAAAILQKMVSVWDIVM